MGHVLVVDDERSMREFLEICLKRQGHTVAVSESAVAALQKTSEQQFDVVITDMRMPGDLDGLGLLKAIRHQGLDTEVIVVTAFATPETAIEAMKQGAYDYLTKPFKVDEINAVIHRAIEKRILLEANAVLRQQVSRQYQLGSMVGRSPQMRKVFEMIGKVHSTRTTVLITGESGTGKELVARALHTEGDRADQPLVTVNCGAIPETLMETELFGHLKGSFTGALADKTGLFQQADKGTLFLDEIGELSLNLQVKLLRALQERKIKPVGAATETEIDVRVIAATNRELEHEVEQGLFRSDLYYRLNVIEIRLPPLRERREDIAPFIEHFVRTFAAEQGKRVIGFEADALKLLQDYDYPGNIRELENIVERGVTLATSRVIGVDSLPPLRPRGVSRVEVGASETFPDEGVDLDRLLHDYERSIVSQALQRSGGVRKRAAELLGISFRSLRYRLAKLGLDT